MIAQETGCSLKSKDYWPMLELIEGMTNWDAATFAEQIDRHCPRVEKPVKAATFFSQSRRLKVLFANGSERWFSAQGQWSFDHSDLDFTVEDGPSGTSADGSKEWFLYGHLVTETVYLAAVINEALSLEDLEAAECLAEAFKEHAAGQ